MTIQALAKNVVEHFEVKRVDNDKKYLQLTKAAPEWMQELVREAHLDMLPNNTSYDLIYEILNIIADTGENIFDLYDIRMELEADYSNHDLLQWLSSNNVRSGFVDEMAEEGMIDMKDFNLMRAIQMGQVCEKWEIFDKIVNCLSKQLGE